jgi:hypothetical protein
MTWYTNYFGPEGLVQLFGSKLQITGKATYE